jgi:SPP1 gp7 family putative phage head morphogenesis protein
MAKTAKEHFAATQKLEAQYLKQLRQVVRQIDSIVKGFYADPEEMTKALNRYAELLRPWSRVVAKKMLAELAARNEKAWIRVGKEMGRAMRKELETAPTGQVLHELLEEQVTLITSLPIEAAQRVHKLTTEGLMNGIRAVDLVPEIMRTGEVTMSRARCIARTEIARTASILTQSRAEHVGSTHYIWRTVGDSDVRSSHKKMNGKVVAWDEPPTLSDGTTTHAGQIYNCRCYAEPILPEED